METKKIAIACFVGAAIGTGVAVIVIPLFWWLGMIAGFGLGYLCYDLKEIREKAPIAWETAKKGSRYSLNWLKIPHPFLCLYLMTTLILAYALVKVFPWTEDILFAEKIVHVFLLSVALNLPTTIIRNILMEKAARRKKCYWQSSWFTEKEMEEMREKNYKQIPINYRNIYGLILIGLGCIALNALKAIPKVLKGIGIGTCILLWFIFYKMWVLLLRFFWYLFKLIHSQKRVLCGFDSAIGVAVTYVLLGSKAVTPAQQIMVVICGGLIGAVVGVLNYEIISKRLLHLVPMTNKI